MAGYDVARGRLARTATVLSQLANVLIFDGNCDETVSGRAWREGTIGGDPKWARRARFINWLFRDPDHCFGSHMLDRRFAKMILGVPAHRCP